MTDAEADHLEALVGLGQALIRAVYDYDSDIALKLDAMLLAYCSVVSQHPQLMELAQRSLLSAARHMVAADHPTLPAVAPGSDLIQ